MRHLAILAPLLITLTAGTSLAIGELSRFNPRSTGLPIAGGTMKGPVAWCTITQAPDDTSPAIGVIGGCATDTGGNVLETSTSHAGPVTITRFDEALSGVNPFTGSTYEQLLWVFGVAASSQTTIQDGGDFRLKEIPWSSPASGDPSVILFKATYQTGSITAFADGTGGEVIVTSAGHGLQENQTVDLSGATDPNYNGTFTATTVLTNTFKITTTWGSTDTGSWESVRFDEAWRSGNVDDYFYQRIFVNDGNSTDFPYAQVVVSENDHGATDSRAFALIGEGLAIDGVRDGGGLLGAGETDGANNGVGMEGVASVAASADTGIAYGARGISIETHAGADNVGSHCNASGSSTANYCLELQAGDINSLAAVNWLGLDNNASMVSWDAAGAADMLLISSLDGEETVAVTAKQTLTTALDASSGAEVAFDLSYTVNKAGGDDTGLRIRQTDTASPGTSLIVDIGVGASTQFFVDNTGLLALYGSSWTDALTMYHDETDAYFKTLDGKFIFQTDESSNTKTTMELKPKGTSEVSEFGLYDTDGQRLLLYTAADRAYIESQGGALGLQVAQVQDVKIWESIASGNPYFYLYGWDGGTSAVQYLRASVDATGDALLETDSGDLIVDTSTGDTRFSDENIKDVGDLQLDSITPDGTDISVAIGGGSLGIGDGAYSWDHTPNVGVEGILEVDGAAHLESAANVGGTLTAEGDIATTSAADWDVLDNTDDTLCIESPGDAGTLCIDSRDGADGVKMAGYLTVDGLATLGGGMVLGGDLDFAGNDGKNLDDLWADAVATDAAPRVTVLGTQPIFVEPAAANVTGANLVLAPSPGERTLDDVTLAGTTGDTLTFDVYSNGVVAQTVKTEGVDWDCDGAGTDIICVCNLYDLLVGAGAITGVTVTRTDGTCSDEKLTFSTDPGVSEGLTVTTSDDVNLDMTTGTDGAVIAGRFVVFGPTATNNYPALYNQTSNRLYAVNGDKSGQVKFYAGEFTSVTDVTLGATGVLSFSGLTELRAPADGQTQFCNAAETNCYTFGASAPDTATLWDKAGTGPGNLNLSGFVTINHGIGDDLRFTTGGTIAGGIGGYTDDGVHFYARGNVANHLNYNFIFTTNANKAFDHNHDTESANPTTFLQGTISPVTDDGYYTAQSYTGILSGTPSTDRVANPYTVKSGNAYAQASAGAASNGANVHVAAGIRLLKLQCDDPTKTNIDTVVFTVNGVAQAALVESTDFDCFGFSADQCCINLAAAIVSAAYGIAPDATTLAGTIYLTPDEDLISVDDIVIGDGEADGVGISLVEGVDGSVILSTGYGALIVGPTSIDFGDDLLFSTDGTHSIGASGTNRPANVYVGTSLRAGTVGRFSDTGLRITAGGAFEFNGLTKWTSSGDGIWEMGINAGTQGWRVDVATLDGTASLYDEAGGALTLGANTFQNTTAGATATFSSVNVAGAATGAVDSVSGNVTAGDFVSGVYTAGTGDSSAGDSSNAMLKSGDAANDSGDVDVKMGVATAGTSGDFHVIGDGVNTYLTVNGETGDLILDDPGASVNSPAFSLRGDSAGTEVEGTINLAFGAQPYLFFSVDDDDTTPTLTQVLHLDDSSIRPASDALLDLGTVSNSFKDAYIDNDVLLLDGGVVGITGNETIIFDAAGTITVSGANLAHNETVTSDAKVTTTDALDNLIASITLADGEVLVVEVTILGRERDGTDRNMYHIKGLFYRQGGGAVQQGVSTYISEVESDVAWCGDLGVAGNDVQITVDGNGDTVDWEVTYTYQILVSAA